MRGAWSLTALAVGSVAAQEQPDWQNMNTIDWRTFGQWVPPTTEAPVPTPPSAPPIQFTQTPPHGYPAHPPAWTPTQHARAKQVAQESPQEWSATPEEPSVTIVYEATTNTIYTTVDVTVTSCPEAETACPAAITWITADSEGEETEAPFETPVKPTPTKSGKPHMPFPSHGGGGGVPSECESPNAPLTNKEQVGNSTWGSLCQPTFPKWLDAEDGTPYEKAPWGDKTTKNSDATVAGDVPDTGDTRHYTFNITRDRISTDGVLRDVILINGQFPGPAIEANWGDMIEVTVNNNIGHPYEGTSLHWHGMLQRDTPWMDGVPAVGQCPIAPYHSYTYKYQADIYGSSWYHAHYSAQYTGGIVGPMIIYGPTSMDYDIDVGPVMLSDWFHVPYFSIVADAVGTDLSVIPPVSDNVLINGRASHDCSKKTYDNSSQWLASNLESDIEWTCVDDAPLSKFKFESGKTHRLRVSNIGADGIMKFQIDGHKLTVIAVDYVPIEPKEADVITLGVGQRSDILVKGGDDPTASYWMRTSAPGGEACGGSNANETLAGVYYEKADFSKDPTTSASHKNEDCINDPLEDTVPDYKITPSPNPFVQNLELSLVMNATGNYEWQINNQTFRANFNEPLLFKAAEGNVSYPLQPQWAVHNFDRNNTVVLNVTNNTPFAHPFHLHGHNMYILDEGAGVWDGSTRNAGNPARRDIQTIRASGFAALQFEADNPGVWRKFSPSSTSFQTLKRPTQLTIPRSLPLSRRMAPVRRPGDERHVPTGRHPPHPRQHLPRDLRGLGVVQRPQRRRPDRRRLVIAQQHQTHISPCCHLAFCLINFSCECELHAFLRRLYHPSRKKEPNKTRQTKTTKIQKKRGMRIMIHT